MKKTFMLVIGLLLISANVFAAGDLIVNGNIGVGNATPTQPLDIISGDVSSAINVDGAITTAGMKKGLNLIFDHQGASTNPTMHGGFFLVRSQGTGTTGGNLSGFTSNFNYESEGALEAGRGAVNVLNINTATAGTTYSITDLIGNTVELRKGSANAKAVSLTNYYGFYSKGGTSGLGSISATNVRHAYFTDLPSYSGTFTKVTGLWVDKQTRGTNNYGIVLNGDGAGADIVFGASNEASIYSSGGELFAKDGLGNSTQISPHDPETGEWRFYSKNIKTGRVVEVNMEKLVKAVEKLTGETFMIETLVENK